MKNLFNNISQDEKNRILEMHSGKKNVITEGNEDAQQKLWNQLVQLVQPLNPKKRTVNQKGSFLYGDNPFKTYSSTILTFNSGKNNEFNLEWPARELEGVSGDIDRVNLFYTLHSKGIGGNNGLILLNSGVINKIKDLIYKTIKTDRILEMRSGKKNIITEDDLNKPNKKTDATNNPYWKQLSAKLKSLGFTEKLTHRKYERDLIDMYPSYDYTESEMTHKSGIKVRYPESWLDYTGDYYPDYIDLYGAGIKPYENLKNKSCLGEPDKEESTLGVKIQCVDYIYGLIVKAIQNKEKQINK